jgi:ATP-dependent DNA ligase
MTRNIPEWIEPMAATLTQERFASPGWSFERKLDGIRLLAFKNGSDVRLLSRNRLPQNAAYPLVVRAVSELPAETLILDGEATGVWGKQGDVEYHIFDVVWRDGEDLSGLSLEERREHLMALPFKEPLLRVPVLSDEKPWDRACSEGWEGVIAKRNDSIYEHRRSPRWLKMKCEATQELVVGGFTDPQGARVGLGALLVGYFDGADFVFAGKLGTGFDTKLLRELRTKLDSIEVEKPPFTQAIGLPRQAHWTKPELVVQAGFIEWTVNGKLRHPRLLGVRTDKAAHDVVRERWRD